MVTPVNADLSLDDLLVKISLVMTSSNGLRFLIDGFHKRISQSATAGEMNRLECDCSEFENSHWYRN